jgi:hypothetical protein
LRPWNTAVWLAALGAASAGLLWQDGGSPFADTTLRDETVQMYGQGLYHYETLRNGAGFKGVDAFILLSRSFAAPSSSR